MYYKTLFNSFNNLYYFFVFCFVLEDELSKGVQKNKVNASYYDDDDCIIFSPEKTKSSNQNNVSILFGIMYFHVILYRFKLKTFIKIMDIYIT